MSKLVVIDGHTLNPGDNPWDPISALGELVVYPRTAPGELLARTAGAQVIITNKAPVRADAIAAMPELRLIAVTATGYNIVDVAAAAARGVAVCNVPEYGTDTVAQFVLALLLELCHHVGLHDSAVKAGEWARSPDFSFTRTPLVELAGLTMGIVGFGRIGRRVGALAHALGMRVIAARCDGATGGTHAPPPGYEPFAWRSLDEVFAEADVVSLHCPLTPQTQDLVDRRRLSRMKPSAMLINTARGQLVVERDLADALRERRIAAAAVDVVSAEPIHSDNPLLSAPNCLITPHIAWATLAARRRMMRLTTENIRMWQEGKPINVVRG